MINYKRIFKSQKLRFAILSFLRFVPDKIMLSIQYYIKLNRQLNLKNPERFTEWLQWYKINYRNPLMPKCVDKYEVKKYVKGKGLERLIIPTLGIYNSGNEIDFDMLPNKFVIKTTDGSGGQNIIICQNKNKLDIKETKKKLDSWKGKKDIDAGREWAYTGMDSSRIIVEEFIESTYENNEGIPDYKFLCFKGHPKYIIYDYNRYNGHKRNIYDINWNLIPIATDCPQKDINIPAPKNLDNMLEIASTLSKDFPFVRVDLYNIDGKIYFGELTFYPWSGYVSFTPDSFDFELGNLFSQSV